MMCTSAAELDGATQIVSRTMAQTRQVKVENTMAFGRIVGGDDKTLSAKLEDLPAFYRELHLIVTTPGKIIVNQESHFGV